MGDGGGDILRPSERTERLCTIDFIETGVGINAVDSEQDRHRLVLPTVINNPGQLFNAIYRVGNVIRLRNPQDDPSIFKIAGKHSSRFGEVETPTTPDDLVVPNGLGLREAVCKYAGQEVWETRAERPAPYGTARVFSSIPVQRNIQSLCRAIEQSGEYDTALSTANNTLSCSPRQKKPTPPVVARKGKPCIFFFFFFIALVLPFVIWMHLLRDA